MLKKMADKDREFSILLSKLDLIFIGEKKKWLRFLLCDALVYVATVTKETRAIGLLQKVVTVGRIKAEDVYLLCQIAELTGIEKAIDLLNDYIRKVPQTGPNFQLQPERIAFFKAIMEFNDSTDKDILIGRYDLHDYTFETEWDLVLHLEIYKWPNMSWLERFTEIFDFINEAAQGQLEPIMAALRAHAQAGGAGPGDDAAEADMGRNSPDSGVQSI